MIPPLPGILVGEGVRGEELNFCSFPFFGSGDDSRLPPNVAAAMRLFKSDSELLRFFFRGFSSSFLSSGGGDCPIVLSLLGLGPVELEGRSSKAPRTVGLSLEAGRLPGDSIDRDRLIDDPLDRLDDTIGSPVAALRLVLLNVRNTDGRSSSLLFCRNRALANLFRNDDAFEVTEPVADLFD